MRILPRALRSTLFLTLIALTPPAPALAEPLLDWADWRKFRQSVEHPSLTIRAADLARARENIRRYPWAKAYADGLIRSTARSAETFTDAFVRSMIEPTTPLSTIFTPCPACRDMGKTWHPHGEWDWSVGDPERVSCKICKTEFPNAKYPETVEIKTTWGTPQRFTFMGGETFTIFGYKNGRPSLSGLIRARKTGHMSGTLRMLGEAYLLSGDIELARAARRVLLRFAEVYPHWLIHSGYGEFADMDPRAATVSMDKLPRPESVYEPNKPDGSIHTAFWSAGRATGAGGEGGFVQSVLLAYDWTCEAVDENGKPIYSEADRLLIEEKLLLEGTILLVGDKPINNKSVGNRTAAAMVGMALGHPGLVRFGIDGFEKTVNEWFLEDGTTSESPAYAVMTFGNTYLMPLASRGYSDPKGFRDSDGKRIDNLNLYASEQYARTWDMLIDGMNGDLTFVPYADGYANRTIDIQWVDLLVAFGRQSDRYLSLLKELCGEDLSQARPVVSMYYREPGLEEKPSAPFMLPDFCPPVLRIGHMRSGADGRESLLVLSASHWGGHHHLDSLNLYYWKDGQELLSDLGYLWDNPMKKMTTRTFAHNTVLIDQADQQTKDRGGEVVFFETDGHVKVMRARSRAYAAAKTYQRTSAVIDHGDGKTYVVDFFDVEGGKTQDFVFHGPNTDGSPEGMSLERTQAIYDLKNVRAGDGSATWKLKWAMGEGKAFSAWSIGQPGERAFIGDGWGQRESRNEDEGAILPYIVRRTTGEGAKRFVTVFEGHAADAPFVRAVTRTPQGLEVETAAGRDIIVSSEETFSVTSDQWTFHHEQ